VSRTVKNLPVTLKYVILIVEEVCKTQFVNIEPTVRSMGRGSEAV
jgi:hypothetical protein